MAHEDILAASDVLANASHSLDGQVADRLSELADELENLAEQDPDHGRVARYQQKLKDIKAEDEAAAKPVDEANEYLNAYRETIEGV